MLYQELYSEIGKLLYAVADVDGAINKEEKKALYDMVRRELVPAESHKDEFGTDAAYYAEIEFDYLEEQELDSDTAFNSFIDFVDDHGSAFDERMKKVCIHMAEEIANAYHKNSEKEAILIKKLKLKLKNI